MDGSVAVFQPQGASDEDNEKNRLRNPPDCRFG
jgi:hypothetical protein